MPRSKLYNHEPQHYTSLIEVIMRFYVPYATPHGPSWYNLHMPVVRMVEHYSDSPASAPPYSSLLKDVFTQNYLHKRDDAIRWKALFPFRLKAGQSHPESGSFSQSPSPLPPEIRNGRVYATSV